MRQCVWYEQRRSNVHPGQYMHIAVMEQFYMLDHKWKKDIQGVVHIVQCNHRCYIYNDPKCFGYVLCGLGNADM